MFFGGFAYGNASRICGRTCWKHSKYRGFQEVSLFHVFSELDDIQSTFGCLFGMFLGTLGSLFLICEGLGSRSEIR